MSEQTTMVTDCKATTNCPEVMAQCLLVKDMVHRKLDYLRAIKEMVLRHLQRRRISNEHAKQESAETEQDRAIRVLRTLSGPVAASHVLARTRSGTFDVPYLSVSVTKGGADWHTDSRNIGQTTTMSFGNFSGGL
eukprot:4260252-Amphidinium_carterae.3